MPTSLSNEPAAAIQARLLAISDLATIVGTRIGQSDPLSFGGFPCVVWRIIGGQASGVDAEAWLDRDLVLQIDVYAEHPDQATDACQAIDGEWDALAGAFSGLNDACGVLSAGMTGWTCKVIRRLSAWQTLTWSQRQEDGGNQVIQRTSDWRFRVTRRQGS